MLSLLFAFLVSFMELVIDPDIVAARRPLQDCEVIERQVGETVFVSIHCEDR